MNKLKKMDEIIYNFYNLFNKNKRIKNTLAINEFRKLIK